MTELQNTNTHLFTDVCSIIDTGREQAYSAVSQQMIVTYWNIGRRIVEEEQQGRERAEYGEQLIERLSQQLTHRYGKGFSPRYLAYFRTFYLTIRDVQILQTRLQNLTWSHIQRVLRVEDPTAIRWYLEMASQEMWSVRTLDRNIATQYSTFSTTTRSSSPPNTKPTCRRKKSCVERLSVKSRFSLCSTPQQTRNK